ncbi:D-glycero-beta-D-manno-heptose 1-phosphate adenylyltransferase [Rapidithrix thailandica]|uniref:D-glycero-beta-D-manno-heptose 1-phosphate adenylyltransferase n=1 Tax=Rapidithrix thailandica TaxID=413964 RepID=A0AAW9SII1_9BACT
MKTPSADKVYSLAALQEQVKIWKQNGQRVVFTNGCFDILHLGHVDYLEKTAAMGDKLIVGLNSDASVKRLKGESRPVNPEHARARVLAALGFVDAVVLFAEDTPFELISGLLPDVLVKGGDYTVETIVGADIVMQHGGEVKTVALVDGFSTTEIIRKAKS